MMSLAAGFLLPLPVVMTLLARPDFVFSASAGTAATSGGAGIGFTVVVPEGRWTAATVIASAVITTASRAVYLMTFVSYTTASCYSGLAHRRDFNAALNIGL